MTHSSTQADRESMELAPRPGRILFQVEGELEGGTRTRSTELLVSSFEGHERISELYEVTVDLFQRLDLKGERRVRGSAIVGRPARLMLVPASRPAAPDNAFFCGMVRRFEVLSVDETRARYRVWLVPRVWSLSQGTSCRIFQDRSAREIVEELLGQTYPHRFPESIKPPRRAYCVQYEESDWSFIARLLADEGISYYFEQNLDGRRETLCFAEDPRQFERLARYSTGHGVVCRTSGGMHKDDEHVSHVALRREVRPEKYTVRDQVLATPRLLATATAGAAGREVYEYIGQPKSAGADLTSESVEAAIERGDERPRMRLEELRWEHLQLRGTGNCQGFCPGHTFVLGMCDVAEELGGEADGLLEHALLLTSVIHRGQQETDEADHQKGYRYGNRFSCIPAEARFRPPRLPRPVIHGVQSGTVVGPRGGAASDARQPAEEIYTDELGRVKVQFPWDRMGKLDEQSSCWIPVMQAWAGPAWGTIFIPRVGQQVVVHFLDGDPDQPIVVGQIYHQQSPPPYELPKHKTRSTIKTASSPGEPSRHRGHNEVRFEDRAGAEELYIRAQLDRNDLVQHDFTTRVGHDEQRIVKNDCQEEVCQHYLQVVGSESKEPAEIVKEVNVNGSQREEILKDLKYWVGGLSHETIVDGRIVTTGMLDETVKGFRKTVVEQGDYTRTVKEGSATFDVKKGRYRLMVKDVVTIESERESILATAQQGIRLQAGAAGANPPHVQIVPDEVRLAIGDSFIALRRDAITLCHGESYIVIGARGILLKSSDEIVGQAKKIQLN